MSGKGRISDIIDLKSVENQKKAMLSMLDEIYSRMGKISDNMISLGIDFKGAEKLTEVIKLREKLITVDNELQKQLAKTAELQIKNDSMLNGEAKGLADVNEQLRKKKQELRDNAKLDAATEGSIEKMRLQLSMLKKEMWD